MRADLERYYEHELRILRDELREYARDHPEAAARLVINQDGEGYPDLERIVHGAALLNARTARRIDDGFPEVVEGFLNVIAPHYLCPFPSTTVLQVELGDALASQADGVVLRAPAAGNGSQGADLVEVDGPREEGDADGDVCHYRLCRDLLARPIDVAELELGGPQTYQVDVSALSRKKRVSALQFRLRTRTPEIPLSAMDWSEGLELFLKEDRSETFELYAFLMQHCVGMTVSLPDAPQPLMELDSSAVVPGGFYDDENLLAYPDRSFPGFGLLSEFFAVPGRFSFIRLDLAAALNACESHEVCVHIFLDEQSTSLEAKVRDGWLRPNCGVAVNLFTPETGNVAIADDPAVAELPVVVGAAEPADASLAGRYEVYSVDRVERVNAATEEVQRFHPVYSQPPGDLSVDHARCYWARREYVSGPGGPDDVLGSDVYIQTADLDPENTVESPLPPDDDWSFSVETTVMDRTPPISGPHSFRLESPRVGVSLACVDEPTATLRPSRASRQLWRVASHLTLSHLSLLDAPSLREMVSIYAKTGGPAARRLVEAIVGCKTEPAFERLRQGRRTAMVSGTRVDLTIDPSELPAGKSYLLVSVLARFLTRFASVNAAIRVRGYLVGQPDPVGVWTSFGRCPVI